MTKASGINVALLALALGLLGMPAIEAETPPALPLAEERRRFLPLISASADRLPDPTPTPSPPDLSSPFGIVMYGNVDQTSGVREMQAAGARRVSTMLDWAAIEPAEGVFNWSGFDTKVQHAQAAGMEVYVLFVNDPPWAWKPDRSATIPEKRINIVRAMVRRYDCDGSADAPGHLCIRYWSFYGEPDYYRDYYQDDPGSKGYWGHRGKEYATMLAGVAEVIHAEDPDAHVLIGGIAYDWFESSGGPFVRSFLPDVLGELNASFGGARQTIDAVAVHYYPLEFPSIRDKVHEIRDMMQAHGVADLPLLVPEAGYWSAPERGSSEAKQAERLVQIYVEAFSVDVRQLSWFAVFDYLPGTGESGLFRGFDLSSPKPAYFAYHTLTRELAGAQYLRPLGQTDVTGYVFRMPDESEKTVVWTASDSGRATFPYSCLRLVTVGGGEHQTRDGDPLGDRDGLVNGRVTLELNEPLYVTACT
ncbi:MAG TPA: beta-galactosidase [Herpetosiphonaceae bacterium]